MANVRDWRVGVNLIGLTNFISTAIGPNLTSCHVKLILVTPLGSKTRKLGAFGSHIPTYCSKTWLERNVFYSQNLQPWNTECVKSGALEGGLIFGRSLAWDEVLRPACCCFELKVTGFHLSLVVTAFLFEVENGVNYSEFAKRSGAFRPSWPKSSLAIGRLCFVKEINIPVAQDLLLMDLELCLPAWIKLEYFMRLFGFIDGSGASFAGLNTYPE